MKTPKILVAIGVSWILAATLLISCGGDSKTTTTYAISGTVSGAITAGVNISVSGAATATATTDGSGAYTVSGLANGSYTVTPSLNGYTFAPVSLDVVMSSANVPGKDFVATKISCDNICNRIVGTGSTECGTVTNTTTAICLDFCNGSKAVFTDEAQNKTSSCILTAPCTADMLATCMTQVADSTSNDNVNLLVTSMCTKWNACNSIITTQVCQSAISAAMAAQANYLNYLKLINTSTINCIETCFSDKACPSLQTQLQVASAVIACLDTCGITVP